LPVSGDHRLNGSLLFGLNVLLAWLPMKSGSLWPAVIFHAIHNLLAFDPVTLGSAKTPWLTGEFGLGLACGYLAICFGALWDGSRQTHSEFKSRMQANLRE
jgi:membrane protease YdiL (CAAX protease family)